MLKVNYPSSANTKKQLLRRYLACFPGRDDMQTSFDRILKKLGIKKSREYDISYILTAPIEKLYGISVKINAKYKKGDPQEKMLKKLFNYDKVQYGKKFQPVIANFFMSSPELNTATCYFCNIDHIYSFKLIGDFKDGLDLVKRATADELLKVKGITKTAAQAIIDQRAGIKSVDALHGLTREQRNNLTRLEPKGRIKLTGEFKDGLDLIKRATADQLLKIKGITKTAAQAIIDQRAEIKSVDALHGLTHEQRNNLARLEPKGRNNLFTLDHVLDKATHPVAALSLFNFVPCCYSCNSKFKRSEQLIKQNTAISPTSKNFSFDRWVRFRLFFRGETGKTYQDINDINDFELDFEIDRDSNEYENYLRVFKLRSRYVFHKREVLQLIRKRRSYSDSQIAEIARLTKRTTQEIKRDIFGTELFEDYQDSRPLTKLKRDIAVDIGIVDR